MLSDVSAVTETEITKTEKPKLFPIFDKPNTGIATPGTKGMYLSFIYNRLKEKVVLKSSEKYSIATRPHRHD